MKKIAAVFLIFIISVSFISCTNDKNTPVQTGEIQYVDSLPDNKFTSFIVKPNDATIDYIIDESENNRYSVFYKDIAVNDSNAYVKELEELGYKKVEGKVGYVAIGTLYQKNNVFLSIAISEGELGIQVIIE